MYEDHYARLTFDALALIVEHISANKLYNQYCESTSGDDLLTFTKRYIEAVFGIKCYIPSDNVEHYSQYDHCECWHGAGSEGVIRSDWFSNDARLQIYYFIAD